MPFGNFECKYTKPQTLEKRKGVLPVLLKAKAVKRNEAWQPGCTGWGKLGARAQVQRQAEKASPVLRSLRSAEQSASMMPMMSYDAPCRSPFPSWGLSRIQER